MAFVHIYAVAVYASTYLITVLIRRLVMPGRRTSMSSTLVAPIAPMPIPLQAQDHWLHTSFTTFWMQAQNKNLAICPTQTFTFTPSTMLDIFSYFPPLLILVTIVSVINTVTVFSINTVAVLMSLTLLVTNSYCQLVTSVLSVRVIS